MVDDTNLNVANELEEIRKRFHAFDQRVESLEKNLCERVEAKMLAAKVHKRRTALDGKWKEALADMTTIHGLKEVLTERHRVLQPSWIIIFVTAMACTTYYINKVVSEYQNDPTATKVRIMRQDKYEYPVMLLCPDTWLDAEKAFSLNISEAGLQYALGFLINFAVHKAPYTIKDFDEAKKEFDNWWDGPMFDKFESLSDFFKYTAVDSDAFKTNCSYCNDVVGPKPFAKIIMNEGVCYNLSLAPTDGRVSLGDLEYLHVKLPNLSKGYLSPRSYWRYVVNPDLSLGMSDTHYLQVFPNHSNTIRVMPHHFKSLPNSNCVTPEEIRSKNYSQSSCVAQCFMTHRNACQPLPLIRADSVPKNVSNVCNTAEIFKKPPTDDENTFVDTPMKCIKQCPSLCEKWVYENSVESHRLLNNEDVDEGVTSFHFLNQIVHYGGILSHEEVPTYSFETLVSNVGGQLGLWLGASLMSLIELFMFVLNLCCEGRRAKRKMQRSLTND